MGGKRKQMIQDEEKEDEIEKKGLKKYFHNIPIFTYCRLSTF